MLRPSKNEIVLGFRMSLLSELQKRTNEISSRGREAYVAESILELSVRYGMAVSVSTSPEAELAVAGITDF